MRCSGLILVMFLLTACGSTRIAYSPSPIQSKIDAMMIIERMLREQPFEHTPEEVFLDEKTFRTVNHQERRSFVTGGITTTPVGQAVYYDNISSVELWQKRNSYIVMLLDARRVVLYRLHTVNLDRAKKFVDAINFMSASDK